MDGDYEKKEIALSVISRGNVVLSTQVLNEICVNLIKNRIIRKMTLLNW